MGNIHREAIIPPKSLPNIQLGFNAKSVLIENPTAAYWYLPDQLRFVPPFVSGMIIPLGGAESVSVLYQAPPGLQQPATLVTPGSASFIFTEDDNGVDSGLSLTANAFGRSLSVISIPFTSPQSTYTFVQPAPNGFLIVPSTSQGGTFTNMVADVDFTGTGSFFKKVWRRASYSPQNVGFAQAELIIYKRAIPVQSLLAMSCVGGPLPALLVI